MNSLFDYARNKIKKEYSARYDYTFKDVKDEEMYKLSYIDYCEEKSKYGIKNSIYYRFKAFWEVQVEDDKLFMVTGLIMAIFAFGVLLYSARFLPFNVWLLSVFKLFFLYFVVLCAILLCRLIHKKK